MNKKYNRRNFLKQAGITAVLANFVPSTWASGFSALYRCALDPGNNFSLLKLHALLPGYDYQADTAFSTLAFESQYGLFNIYNNTRAIFAGQMTLREQTEGKSRLIFFHTERKADMGVMDKSQKFRYFLSGKITCKDDDVLTPVSWEVASKIARDQSEKGWLYSEILNTGIANKKDIVYHCGGKRFSLPYKNNSLAWKWGLISVAQKMSKQESRQLDFACLDEFDSCYNNQSIIFKKKQAVACNDGKTAHFKVFELLGDGIIPAVYWVDETHRVVFVISGTEAYILNANRV